MKKTQLALDVFSFKVWMFPVISITCTALTSLLLVSGDVIASPLSVAITFIVLAGMALAGMSPQFTTTLALDRVRVGSMIYIGIWTTWIVYESLWPLAWRADVVVSAWMSTIACGSGMAFAVMSEHADMYKRPGLPDVSAVLCLVSVLIPIQISDLESPFMHVRLLALSLMWFANLMFQCAWRAKEFTWFYLTVVCVWTLAVQVRFVWTYLGIFMWLGHLGMRSKQPRPPAPPLPRRP